MNKRILVLSLLILSGANILIAATPRKIAYQQGENIFVADLDGGHAKKVATGAWPAISPDSAIVAFNTEGDAKNRPGPERHIAMVDISSGKSDILKDIPGDNCFGPVWSPDGKQLLFMIMDDKQWQFGLVNADGTNFRFLKSTALKSDALGGQEWARDGKSIFCHDLEDIYQIDLDGKLINRWELTKILTDAGMNSGNRLSVSADGKTLLMDADCGAEHERENWDGPQPAVERFDLGSEKAVRVSGKNDFVWDPAWLGPNEFLCIMQKENENEPSIYRMSLDGKNLKLLVKHARTPTVSAP